MKKLVMKFGGTCVKDGATIKYSSQIVKRYLNQGSRVVAVVSAMAGVTDGLLEVLRSAERGAETEVKKFVEELRKKHLEACEGAIGDHETRKEVWALEEEDIAELEKLLSVIAYLKEVTPRVKDYVLSFGERLSTRIFWGALKSQGVDACYLRGWEAGIITDDNFGAARPLMTITQREVHKRLMPLLEKGVTPVVTGFIAATPEGIVTTLGRGGSDYSATIIGAALKVDEIILWKDVDGIMTADPKLVPEAKPIPQMSYEEVVELAYFGAEVVHPLALEPASRENIPIRVKNLFNLDAEGTIITKTATGDTVKALTVVKNVAIVLVSGVNVSGPPAVGAKMLDLLNRLNVQVIMLSQASSQASISIAIPNDALERVLKAIKRELPESELKFDYEKGVCVIAVIGSGMRGKPGVAAKIFNAVASEGVNIKMIAQGSSELNISFAVREEDGLTALRAVHRAFGLNT